MTLKFFLYLLFLEGGSFEMRRIIFRTALLFGLLATSVLPALAQTRYVDAKGSLQSSPVTATTLTSGGATTLNTGWYLCNEALTYTGTITVSGEVNLILGNDCRMIVTGSKDNVGISIIGLGKTLTVWAQATRFPGDIPSTMGNLKVTAGSVSETGSGKAGIAGNAITIYGGTVIANGSDSGDDTVGDGIVGGAGISGSAITIYGGRVVAIGGYGDGGAGISGSAITIYGGSISAEAGRYRGAGIGGGTVTIHGGTVSAASSRYDAGIGDGYHGARSTIIIYGGTVKANGGSFSGAGIGGYIGSAGGSITINDGTVEARGGGGAGIGGGAGGAGGTITINGGTVKTSGGDLGAGIGGGANSPGGTITITGGAIKASGGNRGAGIGGGQFGAGGTVTIDGGTVNASGGTYSAGIGGGDRGESGSIRIAGSANVTANGGGVGLKGQSNGGPAIGHGGGASMPAPSPRVIDSYDLGYDDHGGGVGINPIPNPANKAVAAGDDVVFNVAVNTAGTSAPKITYLWQQSADGGKNWPDVVNGPNVTGTTTATLKLSRITAGMNGNWYRCVVTVSRVGEKSSIVYTTGFGQLSVK